jgi:hypothetical protein
VSYLEKAKAKLGYQTSALNVGSNDSGVEKGEIRVKSTVCADTCSCPPPIGPAGCGPNYPICSACGYTWYRKDCGGCRQCAAPGRKVRTEEVDLPFPIGNGGLDPVQEETLLKRLRSSQRWLTAELENWAAGNPDAASDTDFQKALDGWVAMEMQLRERHGYMGCIHGTGEHCPPDSVMNCDACAGASFTQETRHAANTNEAQAEETTDSSRSSGASPEADERGRNPLQAQAGCRRR